MLGSQKDLFLSVHYLLGREFFHSIIGASKYTQSHSNQVLNDLECTLECQGASVNSILQSTYAICGCTPKKLNILIPDLEGVSQGF